MPFSAPKLYSKLVPSSVGWRCAQFDDRFHRSLEGAFENPKVLSNESEIMEKFEQKECLVDETKLFWTVVFCLLI